jgi:glycosyltransferase involved in cell wall biosynthesis
MRYIPLEKLDVVMPTLNSASRIGVDVFRKVLGRIFTEIPVNRLIVVDDRSKDKTLDVLKEFNVTILNGTGSLGQAREIGIKNVETEWFYFVDDDNLVPRKFHERMWRYADEKTGMIFANAIIPFDNYMTRYEIIVGKFRRALGLKEVVESRGYTGATLVRTQALKGIKIPKIARQEDKFIKKYCEQHGWLVKYASDVIVLHFHRDLPSYKTQYLEGYGLAKVKAISQKRMLISWLLAYPKSLIAFPYVRKVTLLYENPKMYYVKYQGYVDALRSNCNKTAVRK